ncbi:unnamed protein product [Rhizophagus irregularis]|nr:unnamed protein product [Rhizophagus irregularis]
MDNINTPNINNNSSHTELSQINQKFFKANVLEIEPSTRSIEENIFEEDLIIIIDKFVDLHFQETNKGMEEKVRKKFVLDYFSNYSINLQEIYYWLINNQTGSNSIYLLGYFNYYGIGMDTNEQNAFKLYQKAAELENILAQFELAGMYLLGKGVGKNYSKAFELSENLSERKYPYGINRLGYCYEFGFGTYIDEHKAFELYQKAADLGNIFGMYNLGRCYKNGFGTNINNKKAFELFQRAANFECSKAQQSLAWMYEKGYGTEKSADLAIHWYKKSAEQGSIYSKSKLKQLFKE